GRHPTNLPDHCDGCGSGLTLEHSLSCKQGSLVGICHNDVHDKWAHLCSLALTDSQIVIKPTICYGNGSRAGGNNANPTTPCTVNNATPTTPRTANHTNSLGDEACSDVLAHGFWNQGRGTVFNVRICDIDSRSYINTTSSKILERHTKEKKDKCETACLDHRQDFTPLVYSIDGMALKDARTAERRIAWLLAKKWSCTYSDMASFIRTQMSLAIVRSNTLLLHGDRTSPMR
ncbi:hypothetical protein ACHAW6_000224, partial [Cyclotella cf. meneghiniana]